MIGDEIKTIVEQIDPDFPDDYKGDIRLVLQILVEQVNTNCETISAIQLVNDQLNIDNESLRDDIVKLNTIVHNLGGTN